MTHSWRRDFRRSRSCARSCWVTADRFCDRQPHPGCVCLGVSVFNLPVQLQRQLNLAWVVGSVPGAGNLGKRTGRQEIEASWHRELGRIRQVKNFDSKLQTCSFGGLEVLENREIKAMITRPPDLGRRSAERSQIRLADRRGRRRVRKGRSIVIVVHVAADRVYTWHEQRIAAHPGDRRGCASNRLRETVCQSQDRVHAPSPSDSVHQATATAEKMPSLAKGELVSATEVKNVWLVDVGVCIVALNAETRKSRCTIAAYYVRSPIYLPSVAAVRRSRVVHEEIQTLAESTFQRDLQ